MPTKRERELRYIVQLDWNRPVIALRYPALNAQVDTSYMKQVSFICAPGSPGDPRAMYAVIGSLQPNEKPLLFVHKHEAERLAAQIKGAYVDTY